MEIRVAWCSNLKFIMVDYVCTVIFRFEKTSHTLECRHLLEVFKMWHLICMFFIYNLNTDCSDTNTEINL